MAKIVSLLLIAIAGMLLFGCAQQAPPVQPAPAPAPNVTAPLPAPPVQNATPPPQPPEFKPISLAYDFSLPGPNNQPGQKMTVEYYFDEKTKCGSRDALNGFMRATQAGGQGGWMYRKVTAYLDTGEAVYSQDTGESDLAFDNAKPMIMEFDPAFYLQTLAARGNKKLLSDSVWNATKPTLLSNVAVFGTNGDYSIAALGSGTVAGLECKNFTVSAKSTNFDGQMQLCVHKLADTDFSFLTSGGYAGVAIGWQLKSMARGKPPVAYYPQCLEPVACPAVKRATQDDHQQCNAQGKTLRVEKDANGCVSAYNCITYEEDASKELVNSQRPGCSLDEALVKKVADCRKQSGNTNYEQDGQSGCLKDITCTLQPQDGNQPPQ